jgi:hypothetical protein
MSTSLDRLGWKKVFVDMRQEIPFVELPASAFFSKMRKLRSESILLSPNQSQRKKTNGPANLHALTNQQQEQRTVYRSKDVANAVALQSDNRLSLPLGHNIICAFSRTRLSTFLYQGGRPVVDALAKELVEDIKKKKK